MCIIQYYILFIYCIFCVCIVECDRIKSSPYSKALPGYILYLTTTSALWESGSLAHQRQYPSQSGPPISLQSLPTDPHRMPSLTPTTQQPHTHKHTHIENNQTYIGKVFLDFSSEFNTITPLGLVDKLSTLGLSAADLRQFGVADTPLPHDSP